MHLSVVFLTQRKWTKWSFSLLSHSCSWYTFQIVHASHQFGLKFTLWRAFIYTAPLFIWLPSSTWSYSLDLKWSCWHHLCTVGRCSFQRWSTFGVQWSWVVAKLFCPSMFLGDYLISQAVHIVCICLHMQLHYGLQKLSSTVTFFTPQASVMINSIQI